MPDTPAVGGVYLPKRGYNRTGATDTGGTYTGATFGGTTTIGAGATFASPTFTGTPTLGAGAVLQSGAAPGGVGAVTDLVVSKVLVDNTATDFATVTVPNVIAGCGIMVTVASTLGDGDSTQMSIWNIAVARIAGAATAATTSSVGVSATKAGATGNSVVTVAASAMTGAVGATQTFTVTIKNARSAGAAAGHGTTATIRLLNAFAGGCTIVAA